jgi:hypothetical protein
MRGPISNFEHQLHSTIWDLLLQQLLDSTQKLVLDPVQNEPVGSVEAQLVGARLCLKGPDPGVELLSREFVLETV